METSDNVRVIQEICVAMGQGDVAGDTAPVMSAWSDSSG